MLTGAQPSKHRTRVFVLCISTEVESVISSAHEANREKLYRVQRASRTSAKRISSVKVIQAVPFS